MNALLYIFHRQVFDFKLEPPYKCQMNQNLGIFFSFEFNVSNKYKLNIFWSFISEILE